MCWNAGLHDWRIGLWFLKTLRAGRERALPRGNGILFPFSPALEFERLSRTGAFAAIWFALILRQEGSYQMRRFVFVLSLLIGASTIHGATPPSTTGWKAKIAENLPLLGHRNWILVVDSAYPLQSSPGGETIETNADH